MSMEHKAFVFDWESFLQELSELLFSALVSDDTTRLKAWINSNVADLKDPYEGEPLTKDWEDTLDVKDAHQYGDFALTKYYDPARDIGLGHEWQIISHV